MTHRFHFPLLLTAAICAVFASCASKKTVTKSKVQKDSWGRDSSWSIQKDENGNSMAKSDRRSDFEGKRSSVAGSRDFGGQDYTTKSYRKKRWGGKTDFNKQTYKGNTDASRYQKEPWFVQQQARAQGQRASAQGQKYGTGNYTTSNAREQGGKRMAHQSDAKTAARRRVYKQPSIIHWKQQQTGKSVKDTNRILGR